MMYDIVTFICRKYHQHNIDIQCCSILCKVNIWQLADHFNEFRDQKKKIEIDCYFPFFPSNTIRTAVTIELQVITMKKQAKKWWQNHHWPAFHKSITFGIRICRANWTGMSCSLSINSISLVDCNSHFVCLCISDSTCPLIRFWMGCQLRKTLNSGAMACTMDFMHR